MPSLPTITLGVGEILIVQSGSVAGLSSIDQKIQFGQVVAISSGLDMVAVNDYIMFNPDNAQQLMFGTTIYFKTKANNVSGKETPIP